MCQPLCLPADSKPLLDMECVINDGDKSDGTTAVFGDLTTYCSLRSMRDAIALADDSACGFIAIRSIVSLIALGERSDPTRCKVVIGAENYFLNRENLLTVSLKPVNLVMHEKPELMIDVELPLSFAERVAMGAAPATPPTPEGLGVRELQAALGSANACSNSQAGPSSSEASSSSMRVVSQRLHAALLAAAEAYSA